MSEVRVLLADVKIKHNYECGNCGALREGSSSYTTTIIASDTTELKEVMDSILPHPNNMPIGWASFFSPKGTIYLCSECKDEGYKDGKEKNT